MCLTLSLLFYSGLNDSVSLILAFGDALVVLGIHCSMLFAYNGIYAVTKPCDC